jgi:succinyl-diaminopimelate desuccinylase
MNPAVDLACQLIRCPSITPDDAGCLHLIAQYLANLGFKIEWLPFGQVTNLWAKLGQAQPTLCFAGHTDVVPPGALTKWRTPPFEPTIENGYLYGRGAADMKSAIAAFLVATQSFLFQQPHLKGSIAFLLTSDEEGDAIDGTTRVVDILKARNEPIDFCLIGEPSSQKTLGDTIKIGRRGSLTGHLTIKGRQGHIAYPHLAINPIHDLNKVLTTLIHAKWDQGNSYFEPTTWQASYIHSDSGAVNIIPQNSVLKFNFRFSTESSAEVLKQNVIDLLDQQQVNYEIDWTLSSDPSLDKVGQFAQSLQKIIESTTGKPCKFSTNGGTSDGYFLRRIAKELLEFGLLNATIHQTNECTRIKDIETLAIIYQALLEKTLR